MPRCIICDYCNDLPVEDRVSVGNNTSFRYISWNQEEQGYVCSVCEKELEFDLDEYIVTGEPELGEPEFLEEFGMGSPTGSSAEDE